LNQNWTHCIVLSNMSRSSEAQGHLKVVVCHVTCPKKRYVEVWTLSVKE